MSRSEFSSKLTVERQHLDGLEHVNNVVYVQWIQEIAGEHWLRHASEAIKRQVVWVVKKHVIDYKMPCFLGEKLTIKTQTPAEYNGPLWDRYVWVYKENERLAVAATTTWCLLDRNTGKPMRINSDILNVFIEGE
ncbi:MAG: acyl-CoA thioesterase [Cyclobacteriaceae bacterium]